MGALGAELGGRGKLGSTVGAGAREGRRALLAELRAGSILVLAPLTLHRERWSLPARVDRREFSEPKATRLSSVRITLGFSGGAKRRPL